MTQLSPQDLAAQFELYADGWETKRLAHQTRYKEHIDKALAGDAEAKDIAWYEFMQETEARMAAYQLRNTARMVREHLIPPPV